MKKFGVLEGPVRNRRARSASILRHTTLETRGAVAGLRPSLPVVVAMADPFAHVESHVKALNKPRQQNPHIMQAAAEHLRQLRQLTEFMSDADCAKLAGTFPSLVSKERLRGIAHPPPQAQTQVLVLPVIPTAQYSSHHQHTSSNPTPKERSSPHLPPGTQERPELTDASEGSWLSGPAVEAATATRFQEEGRMRDLS